MRSRLSPLLLDMAYVGYFIQNGALVIANEGAARTYWAEYTAAVRSPSTRELSLPSLVFLPFFSSVWYRIRIWLRTAGFLKSKLLTLPLRSITRLRMSAVTWIV